MRKSIVDGKAKRGFTLIELMIVVAIIGILAAIAIPKFADLIRKSNEGATKGNLGSVRSALSIYYGDQEGIYPGDPTALTVNGNYMSSIPKAKTPNYHPDSASFGLSVSATDDVNNGWGYNNVVTNANFGNLWVGCSHTDSKKTMWSSY